MRGFILTYTERIEKTLVSRFLSTIPKAIADRIVLNEERTELTYSSVITALRKEGISPKSFFIYAGLKDQSTEEIDMLVELLDKKGLNEIISLRELFWSLMPIFEDYPIPMTPSDKISKLISRKQFTRTERICLEEATGKTSEELQNLSKFPINLLTQLANATGVSVHWVLGLEDEPFYCRQKFADQVIDYYQLLPEYAKPLGLRLIKEGRG